MRGLSNGSVLFAAGRIAPAASTSVPSTPMTTIPQTPDPLDAMTAEIDAPAPDVGSAAEPQLDSSIIRGSMRENLIRLQVLRCEREGRAAKLKEDRALAESMFVAQVTELQSIANEIAVLEEEVRKAALFDHGVTGEKRPVSGVLVKEITTRTITDRDAALAWAKQTGMALIPESLDEKALLKIASVSPLPFVESKPEYRAEIASDLAKALSEAQS